MLLHSCNCVASETCCDFHLDATADLTGLNVVPQFASVGQQVPLSVNAEAA